MNPNPGQAGQGQPGQGQAPGRYQPGQYQAPYTGQYQAPYTPVAGFADPEAPPVPPVPPIHWRRKEPIGAIVLVGIGLLLLLNEMGYVAERFLHFLWPLLFIGLGVWLIIRRMGDSKGGA